MSPATADVISGRGDPAQKYRIYRLCVCEPCNGEGKGGKMAYPAHRCPECRGEGKTLDLVATCADPQGVGTAIVQNAEEGMFDECPLGILEDGGSWLVKPWPASPRTVSDAAKILAKSKTKGEK